MDDSALFRYAHDPAPSSAVGGSLLPVSLEEREGGRRVRKDGKWKGTYQTRLNTAQTRAVNGQARRVDVK